MNALEQYGRVVWVEEMGMRGLVYNWATMMYDDKVRREIKAPILMLGYAGEIVSVLTPMYSRRIAVRLHSFLESKARKAEAHSTPQDRERARCYRRIAKEAPLDDVQDCHRWLTEQMNKVVHSPDWKDHTFSSACKDLMDVLDAPPDVSTPKYRSKEGGKKRVGIITPPETNKRAKGVPVGFSREFSKMSERSRYYAEDSRGKRSGNKMTTYKIAFCEHTSDCPLLGRYSTCMGLRCPLATTVKVKVRGKAWGDELVKKRIEMLGSIDITKGTTSRLKKRVALPFMGRVFVAHERREIERIFKEGYRSLKKHKINNDLWIVCPHQEFAAKNAAGTWVTVMLLGNTFVAVESDRGGLIYNEKAEFFQSPTGERPRPMTIDQAMYFVGLMNHFSRALTQDEFERFLKWQDYGPLVLRALSNGGLHLLRDTPIEFSLYVKWTHNYKFNHKLVTWRTENDGWQEEKYGKGKAQVETFLMEMYPDMLRNVSGAKIHFFGEMGATEREWLARCARRLRQQRKT
jgi:hypothetical protein